ncbi:hypothetical protein [Flavobacterium sp.]|uniref:hypothetical protein n=1 Tax=Flavobacterium sp. TaxID=239 RepID=UPI0037535949
MKTNFIKLLVLITLISFSSCSSDSNSNTFGEATTYLPLSSTNNWTYDVVTQDVTSRDSLYVGNDTLISAITYKKMKTLNLPNGFFSSSLRNNGLRVDGTSIKMTGAATFDFGLGTPISISLSDFILLKQNGTVNEQLSLVSGTFSQTVSGYPLDFTYTLKSVSDLDLTTYTSPNGDAYTDVKKSKIILNLKITTTQTVGGFPITINILAPQDVVTSSQYYSKDIGMVYTNTNITYTLQDIPGVTLPIPQSGNQTQEEFLDTYLAN